MTLLDRYKADRRHFLTTDGEQDGQSVQIMEDPRIPLRVAVPVADASLLGYLFRGEWLRVMAARE